jgi:hypothetical protein
MNIDKLKHLAEQCALNSSQPTKEQLLDMSTYEMYQLEMYIKKFKDKYHTKHENEKLICNTLKTNSNLNITSADGTNWILTPHALKRFISRSKYTNTDNILACIKSDLNRPFKATFSKKHFKVNALLNHDFENAEYYFGKTTHLLYVVIDGNVIKTCHNNDGDRFKINFS